MFFRQILISALLFIFIPPAAAQDMEELRRMMNQYEEEIRISTALLERTSSDRTTSENQLKIIREQISNRRRMLTALERKMGVLDGDIRSKNNDVERLNAELMKLRRDYAAMVYAAYKNYRLNNFVLFLFSSDDFNQATRRADFMRRYNRARREKAARIVSMSDSIGREVSRLDASRAEMNATRRTHDREVTSLGRDETQYRNSVTQLTAEQQKLRQQVREKEELRNRAQRQIQALVEAEIRQGRGAAVSDADLRAIAALSERFDENKGRLPFPIADGVIVDRFGDQAHHLVSSTRVNNPGINIAGPAGAPVRSVFEGRVMEIVAIGSYNLCLLVRHGNYITVYANVASVVVRKGDNVRAGQTIGHIASSPNRDDNFLHFEIHRETETLNPEQWLRR